jgi:hypothetical protein
MHKIVPLTVQQPPVKRARAIPLSTTVEENEYLLTDDPMMEQEQQQDESEKLQQQQQENREQHEKQLEIEQHQQQQTQVTTEKCMYTIIDKSELNGDVLLTLKLKSPIAATENKVSPQS